MKILIRHIFIALLCIATLPAFTQSLTEYYESKHGTLEGCKTYHGQLDEIFPLEMLICGDKGVYKMYSSSDIYNLSLEAEEDQLEIIEEDSHGRSSGYIHLTKDATSSNNGIVYSGEWQHIESAAKYPFTIREYGQKIPPSSVYISKLTGSMRSRLVDITVDYINETVEIREKGGLQNTYKSNYSCLGKYCQKIVVEPIGFIGVSSVEISLNKKGSYTMVVVTTDQNRESSELELLSQVKSKTKAYSDYRSMLLAEYAEFDDKDLNKFIYQQQADWIKSTSLELRKLLKSDTVEIVSERLKHQAYSWIDIELFTDDFISGVQYKQYNWQGEVQATAFAYNIDKSKAISLADAWDKNWTVDKLESKIENENSTWLVGRKGISKIYFDRVNGIQRETFPYASLSHHIDRGSWLDKLLDQDIIKD